MFIPRVRMMQFNSLMTRWLAYATILALGCLHVGITQAEQTIIRVQRVDAQPRISISACESQVRVCCCKLSQLCCSAEWFIVMSFFYTIAYGQTLLLPLVSVHTEAYSFPERTDSAVCLRNMGH